MVPSFFITLRRGGGGGEGISFWRVLCFTAVVRGVSSERGQTFCVRVRSLYFGLFFFSFVVVVAVAVVACAGVCHAFGVVGVVGAVAAFVPQEANRCVNRGEGDRRLRVAEGREHTSRDLAYLLLSVFFLLIFHFGLPTRKTCSVLSWVGRCRHSSS